MQSISVKDILDEALLRASRQGLLLMSAHKSPKEKIEMDSCLNTVKKEPWLY